MFNIDECILYRNFQQGDILEDMSRALEICCLEPEEPGKSKPLFYSCMNRLVEMASTYGFTGNLWHSYLTYLLANHENAFSTACEITGPVEGTINQLALHDFAIFKDLFNLDFSAFENFYGSSSCCHLINEYENDSHGSKQFNERISSRLNNLSQFLASSDTPEEFMDHMVEFYKDYGVGKLGLHKAFRLEHGPNDERVKIVPITKIAHVHLDDLVGYEKAILNQYYDRGLRIIEVYKHQFKDLNDVIAQIKNRHYKFIIYMDDLSFEDFEIEYKYLKAVIEGGLERKPDNILIYATSNRRHLVREKFSDKADRDDDLHTNDTVQEKLSLVYRFGVTIYFGSPSKKEFQQIVLTLAQRHGLQMDQEELLQQANAWELRHGGLSGRTAQQFIDYLLGQEQ